LRPTHASAIADASVCSGAPLSLTHAYPCFDYSTAVLFSTRNETLRA